MNFLRGEGNSSNLNLESGHIFINGEKAKSLEVIHRSVGYVTQDTILDGNLTPVEALYFTARFKLNDET
jgi:ABC-type multidrug transport system ATPase subunit